MFGQKIFVTQEQVSAILQSTRRDSDELNPVFFDAQTERSQPMQSGQLSDLFRVFDTPKAFNSYSRSESIQKDERQGGPSNTEQFEAMCVENAFSDYLNESIEERVLVTREFDKFMDRPGYYEMNQALEKLERVNRIAEQHLNTNCMKHYGTIAVGLKNIESIDDDNIVSLAKIQVARNLLRDLKDQTSDRARKVLQLHRSKLNVQVTIQNMGGGSIISKYQCVVLSKQ